MSEYARKSVLCLDDECSDDKLCILCEQLKSVTERPGRTLARDRIASELIGELANELATDGAETDVLLNALGALSLTPRQAGRPAMVEVHELERGGVHVGTLVALSGNPQARGVPALARRLRSTLCDDAEDCGAFTVTVVAVPR
jgi:hypothetical protein